MRKIFIYIWVIIFSISIEIPSYINIFDLNCDTSLIIDLDEENEDIEIGEDSELKLFPLFTTHINYTVFQNKAEVLFISKAYNSIFKALDSPPPEYTS